jgi:hypothetical protein
MHHDEQLESPAIEIVMAHLYDLSREELRRVAWEALLVSDGPDSPLLEEDFSVSFVVARKDTQWQGFDIRGTRGWTT